MHWQYNMYQIPLFLAVAVSCGLALAAWRRRQAPGAMPLAFLLLAIAEWTLGYALESGIVQLSGKIFWGKVQYLGITAAPVAWLIFVLRYTGRWKSLTGRNVALLAVLPLTTVLLAWTNESHHLIHRSVDVEAGGVFLDVVHGSFFWVHAAYAYLLLLVGTILLFEALFRSPLYRAQAATVLAGALAPWIANALYLSGLNPFVPLDLTPFAFTLSGLAVFWSLFRLRLLDITPVARDATIEGMNDGVIVLDIRSRVVDLNPAAERIIGRPNAEVVGQPAARVLPELPRVVEDGPAVLSTGIVLGEQERQRHYDLRSSPLYNRFGSLAGRLIVLHDVTEHKRGEASLRQYAVELQAQNEELNAFAHTVAHDLQGPLASIVGYAEFLAKHSAKLSQDELGEYLCMIAQSGRKMSNIIRELLLLASVREAEVERVSLDMPRIVGEAMRVLGDMVETHQAEMILPASWPVALGHGPWVEEVWVNYLSNALKYGGRPPRVELGAAMQAEGMVCFWVRDNGRGLLPEDQARLFVPFTQVSRVRVEGQGLGLSIVRRIVEKLGGQVGLESEIGRGSVFWFTLPAGPMDPT